MAKPLPKPTVNPFGTPDGKWTGEAVNFIAINPVYAGMGPFPAIVDEETFIRSAAKAIDTQGAEQFLVNLITVLRYSMQGLQATKDTPVPYGMNIRPNDN